MDTNSALPFHPLVIHFPVVLVPAFIAALAVYLLIPRLRRHIGWLVMGLAVTASAAAGLGWWSGHQFYDQHVEMISQAGSDTSKFTTMLATHLEYGDILAWLVPITAALTILFGVIDRKRRRTAINGTDSDDNSSDKNPQPAKPLKFAMIGLAIVTLGMAGASGWFVYQTGHSGAEVVWSTENK